MTHAGFWVDGAVRKPEWKHADKAGWVICKEKQDTIGHIQCSWNEVDDSMIWLDTTPRESLTPEELFSVAKVLWPDLYMIRKDGESWLLYPENDQPTRDTPIDWGNLTQYPPPVEPQWIHVTRENVGQYLFCECRFRDAEHQEWRNGRVSGWDEQDGCCLVNSDFEEEMPIMQWNIVEVQNAPTP